MVDMWSLCNFQNRKIAIASLIMHNGVRKNLSVSCSVTYVRFEQSPMEKGQNSENWKNTRFAIPCKTFLVLDEIPANYLIKYGAESAVVRNFRV